MVIFWYASEGGVSDSKSRTASHSQARGIAANLRPHDLRNRGRLAHNPSDWYLSMAVLTSPSVPNESLVQADSKPSADTTSHGRWLVAYVVFQFLCQVGLLVPAFGGARALFRMAAFGVNLVLLAFITGPALTRHPARTALALTVGLLVLNVL